MVDHDPLRPVIPHPALTPRPCLPLTWFTGSLANPIRLPRRAGSRRCNRYTDWISVARSTTRGYAEAWGVISD